jgi:hypothetical protein
MTDIPTSVHAVVVPHTRHGFLERPGRRVYFEVTGSWPAIVFAHGNFPSNPTLVRTHIAWLLTKLPAT